MPTYLSQEALEQMKEELKRRESSERKEIAEKIAEATALGDLSENFEYQTAKEEQGTNEARIAELREMIRDAVIVEEQKGGSEIRIGATFDVETDEKLKTFQVVGSNEANPLEGKISNESPIGQAFLGKAVGDHVNVEVPSGTISYKVVKIH